MLIIIGDAHSIVECVNHVTLSFNCVMLSNYNETTFVMWNKFTYDPAEQE
ncbi:MAG: hypothetical protein KQI35_17325 [Bacteroidetes bacterium]|nr:hypothetical protein [Bacteroidota bacterium]